MFDILVADDHPDAVKLMQSILQQASYRVHPASNGREALDVLQREHVDLALVDLMMPELDGMAFTQAVRKGGSDLPIIMVTARQDALSLRQGFLTGVDDYMTKPVDPEELLLRIAAVLRRSKIVHERRLQVGSTLLDCDALTVKVDEAAGSPLPRQEFLLLYRLLFDLGRIFTRRQLMDELWARERDSEERTVDVHINRLRDRFRDNPDFELVTVRGLGYKAVRRDGSPEAP